MTELERDSILLDLQTRMKTMQATLHEHDKKFESIQAILHDYDKKFESIQAILQEHDEKLQMLLDVYPEFYKKFASFAKNFVSNDHRFDNLEARVFSLESKAANQ